MRASAAKGGQRAGPSLAWEEALIAPLVRRVLEQVHAAGELRVLGVCGAQGSGKSTLAAALEAQLADAGARVATLSLDDLYFDGVGRAELAREAHPLLATRGPPGTHDVALGLEVIRQAGRPGRLALPRFDKASDEPVPRAAWPVVDAPLDVLLFEGWCVGARAQDEAALALPCNRLERDEDPDGRWRRFVDAQLRDVYPPLFAAPDLLVLLQAPGFEVVSRWRREQEEALQARLLADGRTGGMTPAALDRFILHYERITRAILAEMPGRADVVAKLDGERRIESVRWAAERPSPAV